jgi:hypothetical protein
MDKASCHECAFFLNALAAMLDGETEYIFIPGGLTGNNISNYYKKFSHLELFNYSWCACTSQRMLV